MINAETKPASRVIEYGVAPFFAEPELPRQNLRVRETRTRARGSAAGTRHKTHDLMRGFPEFVPLRFTFDRRDDRALKIFF